MSAETAPPWITPVCRVAHEARVVVHLDRGHAVADLGQAHPERAGRAGSPSMKRRAISALAGGAGAIGHGAVIGLRRGRGARGKDGGARGAARHRRLHGLQAIPRIGRCAGWHPHRPHCFDGIDALFRELTPPAVERDFADDPAAMGGTARFDDKPVVVIGHEKGHDNQAAAAGARGAHLATAVADAAEAAPIARRGRALYPSQEGGRG